MIAANFTVTEVASEHRRYVLDCAHARTTVDYLAAPGTQVDEDAILEVLRERHAATCACGLYVRAAGAA